MGPLRQRPLNQRLNILQGRLANPATNPNRIPRIQKRINRIQGKLGQPLTTWGAQAAPAPAAPVGNQLPPGTDPSSLFPSTRIFEPQNYGGSPLYQFQVQEGQKQLGKSLAARGLTNSGYGIEQELNIPLRAAAQDTDRMTRLASENADRLQTYQQNEALRQERAGNDQWNRAFSIAELMAQQSPWNAATNGLDQSANYKNQAGQSLANYLSQAYQHVYPSGGGAQPIPLPAGPNYTNVNQAANIANSTSNQNWWNTLANSIAGFF